MTKKYGNQGRITRQDVADHAGVSTATVSYVINGGPRNVAPKTRKKVLEAIDKLGYHPDRNAQRLTRRAWGTSVVRGQYGLIFGGGHDMILRPYYASIIHGFFSEAERLEREIRFMQVFNIFSDPLRFNQLVHPEEITGLAMLIPSVMVLPESIDELQQVVARVKERVPNLVLVDNSVDGVRSVTIDRHKAAEQAIQHLCNLGHQRIAYVGSPDERLVGYQSTMEQHGYLIEEVLIRSEVIKNQTQEAYDAIQNLAKSIDVMPTAIFAATDEVAVGVYASLRDLGLNVPSEVSVVGVDDTPYAIAMMPSLTTVHIPTRQMGIEALRLLVAQEDGNTKVATRSIELQTKLIERNSTKDVLDR
ncbi:MAG: LacI family DNA-binding transcriptional regulator [Chloroflexota bacterium]